MKNWHGNDEIVEKCDLNGGLKIFFSIFPKDISTGKHSSASSNVHFGYSYATNASTCALETTSVFVCDTIGAANGVMLKGTNAVPDTSTLGSGRGTCRWCNGGHTTTR